MGDNAIRSANVTYYQVNDMLINSLRVIARLKPVADIYG